MSQSQEEPTVRNGGSNEKQQVAQPSFDTSPATELRYVALYCFEARAGDELSFVVGETLHIINSCSEENWWLARSVKSGREGNVPSNYLAPAESINKNPLVLGRLGCEEAVKKHVRPGAKQEPVNRVEKTPELSQTHYLPSQSAPQQLTPSESPTQECAVRPKIRMRETSELWEPPHLIGKKSYESDKMTRQDQRLPEVCRDGDKTTDVWEQDSMGHEEQYQLYPHMLIQRAVSTSTHQQLAVTSLQVQSLNVSGHDLPVFLGPVTSPTFHIHGDISTKVATDQQVVDKSSHQVLDEREQEHGPRSGDLIQKTGDKAEAALKALYRSTGSYVQLMPGVDDDQRHITGMYTKLQLETREGVAVVNEGRSVRKPSKKSKENSKPEMLNSSEYDAIFEVKTREGDLVKRFIFYGMGGLGKSTFIDKVAHDWAIGSSDVLGKYKLVLVLKMCALDQTSDLTDSVFDQLLGEDSGVPKEALRSFIQRNQDKVLILLDGFDELKTMTLCQASFGSILKALNRQTYRDCCVCVTTRTSHLDRLLEKSLVQNPCTHVKVLGFSENDVKEYVHKFYVGEPDSAEVLIKSITESSTLSDLSISPMLLLLMCLLWREHEKLPETTSRIYSQSIDYMFTRKGQVSEEDKLKTMLAIGKVALQGLLADEQRLSFAENEFPKDALDLALKVGILTRQRVFKNLASHNSVEFIHKTMQEYCAAKYWQSLHESKSRSVKGVLTKSKSGKFHKTLDVICSSNHGVHSFGYLLRFCCGDNETLTKIILNRIINLCPVLDNDKLQKLLLMCYFEGQSNDLPPHIYISSLVKSSILINHETDHLLTLVHFLSNACRPDSRNPKLTNVEHIHFEKITSVYSFAFALSYMDNLNSLTVHNCSLVERDVTRVLLCLKENTHLTTLDFSENPSLGGTAAKWAPNMKHLNSLEVLTMRQCNIHSEDVQHICKSLSKDVKLTLDLSYNGALAGSAVAWSPHIHHTGCIEKLVLSNCSLLCQDIEHIALALCKTTNLTHLDLSCNSDLGASVQFWAPHLCHMKYLKVLVLAYCSLCDQGIGHLAKALCNLTKLKQLDLSFNSTLGGSANLWSEGVLHMKHLKRLVLNDCSLSCTDVDYLISCSLNYMVNLSDLEISHNSAIGGLALFWTCRLPGMKYLKNLVLRDCSLLLQDVEPITLAVRVMTNLRSLDLSFNSELGASVQIWSPYLRHMKHLSKLDLSGCLSKCTDVEHVTSVIGNMTNLVELYLSFNKVLGGSASLWSPHLHHIKHISRLVMANCSLQCADVEHIASSVCDMTKLTELNLSDNRALSGSAELWCRWLPRMKHLKVLVLRGCSLGQVKAMRTFVVA